MKWYRYRRRRQPRKGGVASTGEAVGVRGFVVRNRPPASWVSGRRKLSSPAEAGYAYPHRWLTFRARCVVSFIVALMVPV